MKILRIKRGNFNALIVLLLSSLILYVLFKWCLFSLDSNITLKEEVQKETTQLMHVNSSTTLETNAQAEVQLPINYSNDAFYALFPQSETPQESRLYSEKINLAIKTLNSKTYFKNTRITRIIHHSWKTANRDLMDDDMRSALDSFSNKNPDVVQIVWDDEDIQQFTDSFYPSIKKVFRDLPKAVLRADLFRYMVLATFGGVYSDIDTRCLKPIDEWTAGESDIDFLVGVEADPDRADWAEWYARRLQWVQWTLSAAKGHPAMKSIVLGCLSNLLTSMDVSKVNVM